MPIMHEGSQDGSGLHIAIVQSRFNAVVCDRLASGALTTLARHGVADDAISVVSVPGAFEIPQAARLLASAGKHDAIICLGAVVRGETPHFDYVCEQAAAGLQRVALDTGVPVAFGVLTTDTVEQALARAGGSVGNKGYEAVHTVFDTLQQLARVGDDG